MDSIPLRNLCDFILSAIPKNSKSSSPRTFGDEAPLTGRKIHIEDINIGKPISTRQDENDSYHPLFLIVIFETVETFRSNDDFHSTESHSIPGKPWPLGLMTFASIFITFFPTDLMQLISSNRLLIIVYENIDFMLS